jgi:hypothetical protein
MDGYRVIDDWVVGNLWLGCTLHSSSCRWLGYLLARGFWITQFMLIHVAIRRLIVHYFILPLDSWGRCTYIGVIRLPNFLEGCACQTTIGTWHQWALWMPKSTIGCVSIGPHQQCNVYFCWLCVYRAIHPLKCSSVTIFRIDQWIVLLFLELTREYCVTIFRIDQWILC